MNLRENTQDLQHKLDREVILRRITERIRKSLELPEILTVTAHEVRSFLGTERILIYQFQADGSGEVVAESIYNNSLPSLKGLNFPADDIPITVREMYIKVRQRTVVNVAEGAMGLSPLDCEETGQPLVNDEICYRSLDPCHASYLTAMGVKSSLVVPILPQKTELATVQEFTSARELWGLLVSHHSTARNIAPRDLEVVQLVVDQLSMAIAHSNLLAQSRRQAQCEATTSQIATLLHGQPTIQFQQALEATVQALGGSGGRLYIQGNHKRADVDVQTPLQGYHPEIASSPKTWELFTCGEQPIISNGETFQALETHPLWQQWMQTGFRSYLEPESEGQQPASSLADHSYPAQETKALSFSGSRASWVITDLYKEPLFRVLTPAFYTTPIRGLLVIPLLYRQEFLGCLTIFRNEIDTEEKLWAGYFDSSLKQLLPRPSFQVWREIKKGQSQPWLATEIELAKALTEHFSMAIQQYLLYKQVQAFNAKLEQQVQERTAQLQKQLEFARVLSRITDQIRSTLDLKTILQTIVREVRALLNTDRVIIFHLNSQREGEVLVAEVRDQWPSLEGMKTPQECFPEESARLYHQGRVQVINDINLAEISPCHREFLENLQVKANLIVPIGTGENLWGLLIAHECEQPRKWKVGELNLLQQLAHQAAIAIQQAELYASSRAATIAEQVKAEQLEKTLAELGQTQAQLIQTEKMSGLGQLVAGVAHEINNPVNFIYGNLAHASEYVTDLLDLVQLYEKYYPNPVTEILEQAVAIDLEFLAEDLPKILASMQLGAERIRQLVLSLRNFSRLDQAEQKPVNIHEGIDSTLVILQHRLKPKPDRPGIEVIKEYGKLPPVECYAGLLNQVFMNIISNAIDALEIERGERKSSKLEGKTANLTPQNSETTQPTTHLPCIRITTQTVDSEKVLIRIADNGHGIPETLISQVFNPFFTTKPVGRGTGLGLSISYQIIVEKHKGSLRCISQPNQGTEFWIEIPIKGHGK